jgi:hypothetical protein
MGYPLKKHAYGYREKTVCGQLQRKIPAAAMTGRSDLVTCKNCNSILRNYPESIPPRFLPASPAAKRSQTIIIRPGSLPKGDCDDAG